ncbi:cytochrome P450 86B1-like [Cryptomeria japonica]|uniref:cytochrome P450 86B1-like n=1 Tax=Cryptomeria japonica TaxID=3369 RepID=UPI0027D9E391|nr:cytochrome P450 86B1-like [Cryptomeria japonica]
MAALADIAGNGWTYFQVWCVGITSVILIWCLRSGMRLRFRGAPVWPLPSMLFQLDHLYDCPTHLLIVNGGTLRLPGPWKCRILTADLANIDYLLKTRYHNFGKGDIFKDSLRDMFGNSILVQDGEAFKRVGISIGKALSSPAFRDRVTAALPSVMQQKLVPVFTHACENAAIIDLKDVFHRLACYNFFNVLSERRFLKARNFVYDFVVQEWHSRGLFNKEDSAVADIAFTFLRYERECGRVYSEKRRQELLVNLIFAGKDTATTGLTWFFWLLTKHPQLVEAEILAELQEIVKQRKSPDDQDSFGFSFEEKKRMEYLHAAVTEALRFHLPVPFEITVSKEDDVLPDGTPVKKGAQVLYSIYSSGRLENVWGVRTAWNSNQKGG